MATVFLIASAGFSAQPDKASVVVATVEQDVLVVRRTRQTADANGRSDRPAVRDDAALPSQDASHGTESTENSVLVMRRKQTEASEEKRDNDETTDDRSPQATPFPVDAVSANPPAWTSVRTSHYDGTNRAWSLHTSPFWSYHPHALSYNPKRYQGFQPRRSWTCQPVHRQKYRSKRDWTYHRQ